MKLLKLFVVLLVVGVLYLVPGLARASYITLPGSAGIPSYNADDCEADATGVVTPVDSSSTCVIYFPIPIAAGYTLSSVTLYYYDNSGSQGFVAGLERTTLSSDSESLLASGTDYTTSASVQTKTLSYGSATSSSYAYFVYVFLSSDTELRGIKIYYY